MTTHMQSFDNIEEAYPLLQLQLGMLFHSEYVSKTAIYHDIISHYLRAPFDVEALRTTLRLLAARHSVLRTSFDLTTFSTPLQLVHHHVELPLQIEDLRHLSRNEQKQAVAAWKQKEQYQGFEWTQPPLLRFYVHRSSSEEFLLSLSVHHAILDGWSVASLITELVQIYFSSLGQATAPLLPAPLTTFRDFVAMEQEALASQEQRAYWMNQLQDAPITILPRWPASYRATAQAGNWDVQVPATVWEGVQQLAQVVGVPLKTVLLAAHLRIVSLLSGQQEIVTGLVSHGRPETRDGERVLGLFLNTVPFRFPLGGGTWRELLKQTFEAERNLLPFRRYPLAQIQKTLRLRFDTVFNFTYFHVYQGLQDLEELDVLGGDSYEETNFPLVFQFSVDNTLRHVQLSLNYNTAELCERQIQAIAESCKSVLTAMSSSADACYHYQSFLAEAEYHQMIIAWNATQRAHPQELCAHELVAQQAKRTPEAIAVVFQENYLSYAELNRQANQLAHHLQARGVGPDVPVGICMERSPELVIGLLGILKAGGAYVPLDPAYPQERLIFMLEDAHIQVVVLQEKLLDRFCAPNASIICVERDRQFIAQQSQEAPCSNVGGANLAYILYTSGSTGQPKGVEIVHANLLNLIYWHQDAFSVTSEDRATQFSSPAFDATGWELWPYLSRGASISFPDEETRITSTLLRDWLVYSGITVSFLPTPVAESVIGLEWPPETSLRFLLTGADTLHHYPPSNLPFVFINNYGPTETTVVATSGRIDPTEYVEALPSIGRPIANTQIYILDEYLQPVPVATTGGLYIGGDGLARGYHGQQALTAERFIPHPFSTQPGARLYRTGDLARYHVDGSIEFLGRQDTQVKLRGYRIEPGEIEQVFLKHGSVQECVVILREDVVEGGYLVAYVVSKADMELPTVQELRHYAQQKLPSYMVPASIVILEHLPLTTNGKVDRHSLPVPSLQVVEWQVQKGEKKFLSPMEELALQVWKQVLRREEIGLQENFFEIGGHSLLATQVAARLRKLVGVEIPLQILFEAPTVAELVVRIQQELQHDQTLQAPPIVVASRSQELPLSFAQQRLWFLDQLEPGNTAYSIPITIEIEGELDIKGFDTSLAQVIERHEGLHTTFHEQAGQPYQVISSQKNFNMLLVDLQVLSENQREKVVRSLTEQEERLPFDLSKGPLLRCTLLRLAAHKHWLRLNMHHIVSDGWSMGVLVEELTSLYQGYRSGDVAPLPPLPIQYADYAHWQRSWLQGDILKEHLRYWTRQLSGAHALELPTDYPRSDGQPHRGAKYEFQFAPDLTPALERLSRQEGATLFMTLFSAFQVLLYRLSGEEDIVVGTDSANRSQLETEGLIGFFVNLLALRTNLHDNPKFLSVLHSVREMVLGAYMHQELPFEMIVEHLRLERERHRTPLVNVLFVMQNVPVSEGTFSDVVIRQRDNETSNTKFDLTLFIAQGSEHLYGSVYYRSDLFKHETIVILLKRYEVILHSFVAQPHAKIASIDIATEDEKTQKVREQAIQRKNLRVSRGERLRVTVEDSDRLPGS